MPRFPLTLAAILLAASLAHAQNTAPPPAKKTSPNDPSLPANAARTQLSHYLNAIADEQIAARDRAIARITTAAQAQARQRLVRAKILSLIGGLPTQKTPLNAQSLGTWQGDGFRIERILFESHPHFYVTADLYLPDSPTFRAPYPAIIDTPGHGATGKLGEYQFAASFARNGIAVLAIDPLGQGERLQYFNPATGKSNVGAATGEHGEASVSTMLAGVHISQYFLWDDIRSLDYLTTRRDIDPHRIGAFGCSGGGTDTAYFAALEPRLAAAAVACYITSEHDLLNTLGPQDAEQSIPNFIASGLGFPDWPELFAPKPYAIVSTTSDMFPFAGAKLSHDEAAHFYSLLHAEKNLHWIVGPGGHGNLRPITPQIINFFQQSLGIANATTPLPQLITLSPAPASALLVTTTGQVSTAFPNAETVFSLNKTYADNLIAHRTAPTPARLRAEILALTHATVKPGAPAPSVTVMNTFDLPHSHVQQLVIHVDRGIDIPASISVPIAAGKFPAEIQATSGPPPFDSNWFSDRDANGPPTVILILGLRPSPAGSDETKSPLLGTDYLLSLRALLVGKTLLGMHMDDIISAANYLASLPSVDKHHIDLSNNFSYQTELLYATFLDSKIRHTLWFEPGPPTYKEIVDTELHRDVSPIVLPGVIREYDLPDIEKAIGPRLLITPSAANASRK